VRVWRAPRRSLSTVGWCAPAAQSQPPGRGPPSAARPPGHSRTRGRATRRSCRWHQMFHEAPACRVRAGGGRAHRPRPAPGRVGRGVVDETRAQHTHTHATASPPSSTCAGVCDLRYNPARREGEKERGVFSSLFKRGSGCAPRAGGAMPSAHARREGPSKLGREAPPPQEKFY
jgi:hypothetical protein